MNKITLEVGTKYGGRKRVTFTGDAIGHRTVLQDPSHDSRGKYQELYEVKGGYRVFERNWSHWRGENDENYFMLSGVMTREDLMENYCALAADCDIMADVDLDENPNALEE